MMNWSQKTQPTLSDQVPLAQAAERGGRPKRAIKRAYGDDYDMDCGGSQSMTGGGGQASPKRQRQVLLLPLPLPLLVIIIIIKQGNFNRAGQFLAWCWL